MIISSNAVLKHIFISDRKTVELFFVNGINDGLVTASLSNWNGGAVKILRNDIPSFSSDQIDIDISGSGVYFLFGKDESCKPAHSVFSVAVYDNLPLTIMKE